MRRPIVSIDAFVRKHKGNVKAAAAAVAHDYYTFWRWHQRKVFAPENSETRKAMARKGIDLPRREDRI